MTADIVLHAQLTASERTSLLNLEARIGQGFTGAFEALREIRDRKLYREFGTWENYCRKRWKKSARRMRHLLAAMRVVAFLRQNARGKAEQIVPLPTNESQVRPLVSLPDEQAADAWKTATALYGGNPTGADVARVVQREADLGAADRGETDSIRRQVYGSRVALVIQRMEQGKLTPEAALATCDALASSAAVVRGHMLGMEVYDPTIIREMNRLYKAGRDSYTEIVASKHLQYGDVTIPMQRAQARHLRDYLDWKRTEYARIAQDAKDYDRGVMAVEVVVYRGDADRTAKVLQKVLDKDTLKALAGLLAQVK